MSRVVLVGAGPGDVDLLTSRGKKYIEQADCIIYDRLASKEILNFAKGTCECIFVGKENHKHVMKQDDINSLLAKKSEEYELVVRLKGGDPYVFGRGGEEALFLKKRGIEVEVVPGVTSAISVLAYAGIPITHRGLAKGFQVITAHSKKDEPSEIDFSQLLDTEITLVFLMGLAHVEQIAQGLIAAGRSPQTKAAVISRGTTAEQRKCVGTLETIADLVRKAGLVSPSIIVVGDVVGLSEELSFFESRPLFGKTVIVPYIEGFTYQYGKGIKLFTENRLIALLREKGAEVTGMKIGKIIPARVEFERGYIEQINWLIFTSANGVYSFMYNLEQNGLDIRSMANARIAVVGKKTAAVLKEFSINPDFVSKGQTAEALAYEMCDFIKTSDKILYVSALVCSRKIEELLSTRCSLEIKSFYENRENECDIPEFVADYICFTSASGVNRVLEKMKMDGNTKAVTIGSSSTRAVLENGYSKYIQAEDSSYEGMIAAILDESKEKWK